VASRCPTWQAVSMIMCRRTEGTSTSSVEIGHCSAEIHGGRGAVDRCWETIEPASLPKKHGERETPTRLRTEVPTPNHSAHARSAGARSSRSTANTRTGPNPAPRPSGTSYSGSSTRIDTELFEQRRIGNRDRRTRVDYGQELPLRSHGTQDDARANDSIAIGQRFLSEIAMSKDPTTMFLQRHATGVSRARRTTAHQALAPVESPHAHPERSRGETRGDPPLNRQRRRSHRRHQRLRTDHETPQATTGS
jgi:hypothetical protein